MPRKKKKKGMFSDVNKDYPNLKYLVIVLLLVVVVFLLVVFVMHYQLQDIYDSDCENICSEFMDTASYDVYYSNGYYCNCYDEDGNQIHSEFLV